MGNLQLRFPNYCIHFINEEMKNQRSRVPWQEQWRGGLSPARLEVILATADSQSPAWPAALARESRGQAIHG